MAKTTYILTEYGNVLTTDDPDRWPGSTRLSAAEGKRRLATQAKDKISTLLSGADKTFYVVIRSVSASGMSRTMSVHMHDGGSLRNVTRLADHLLGWGCNDKGYLKVQGCGMDMAFHTISSLYSAMGLDYKTLKCEIV